MMDLLLTAVWLGVLLAGIGATLVLRTWGLRSTHARDLLHIGAGIWVLGWPLWDGWLAPTLIVLAALTGVAAVPRLALRSRLARRFVDSVTGGDERYAGLVQYAGSFAILTPVGVLWHPFPAGAALLALAWGDGPGGLVGRRFGSRRFELPYGKPKTLEGTITVAVGAALSAALAALWLGPSSTTAALAVAAVALGLVAAAAEALSPRGSDNALVPAAVFAVAMLTPFVGSPS
jgi:dolichol kinase